MSGTSDMVTKVQGDPSVGELGAGGMGDPGLLWLAPIKVQSCGALATTVMMLTWLTALMRCLQSGCRIASTTIIIATGACTLLPPLFSPPFPPLALHQLSREVMGLPVPPLCS